MTKAKEFLSPINNTSVVQQVIERLTMAMIHKELRPGDKIPTELELSTNFGVGRNSVREAIKILVSFGVLEIKRPEGTFVTKGFADTMIDPLLYGIILAEDESMDSLKELREWIDTGMLLLAMKKAGPDDIQLLERAADGLTKEVRCGDVETIFAADNRFHEILAEITHNSLFGKIAGLVRLLTYEMRHRTICHMLQLGEGESMAEVHQEIFRVLKEKDCSKVDRIIKQSYFYEEGALDE